ncbi:hypothetical protein [Brevibacterium sp.]|uniref:hypothetical protein n=1 Tax=Brevibacterium sp. TaxID=1701 RepID=UPI00281198C9|nr:hypothetical protein [Brevibacterium sp.]
MEPGLGAVIFLTFCIIGIFSLGFFLVYRVMTKPGSHIGARLPREDAIDAHDPDSGPGADGGPGTGPDSDRPGDDPTRNDPTGDDPEHR